jgi:hypothetical protein
MSDLSAGPPVVEPVGPLPGPAPTDAPGISDATGGSTSDPPVGPAAGRSDPETAEGPDGAAGGSGPGTGANPRRRRRRPSTGQGDPGSGTTGSGVEDSPPVGEPGADAETIRADAGTVGADPVEAADRRQPSGPPPGDGASGGDRPAAAEEKFRVVQGVRRGHSGGGKSPGRPPEDVRGTVGSVGGVAVGGHGGRSGRGHR